MLLHYLVKVETEKNVIVPFAMGYWIYQENCTKCITASSK